MYSESFLFDISDNVVGFLRFDDHLDDFGDTLARYNLRPLWSDTFGDIFGSQTKIQTNKQAEKLTKIFIERDMNRKDNLFQKKIRWNGK